jgi:hypothetical protein
MEMTSNTLFGTLAASCLEASSETLPFSCPGMQQKPAALLPCEPAEHRGYDEVWRYPTREYQQRQPSLQHRAAGKRTERGLTYEGTFTSRASRHRLFTTARLGALSHSLAAEQEVEGYALRQSGR